MTTGDRDERDGLDPREDAALWTLLGRREPPAPVSPYFSRRVLREVALAGETRRVGWRASLRRLGSGPLLTRRAAVWSGWFSGTVVVALLCLTGGRLAPSARHAPPVHTPPGAAVAQGTPEDFTALGTVPPEAALREDEAVPVPEVEVIADLDNILQREESRLWTDDNSVGTARF